MRPQTPHKKFLRRPARATLGRRFASAGSIARNPLKTGPKPVPFRSFLDPFRTPDPLQFRDVPPRVPHAIRCGRGRRPPTISPVADCKPRSLHDMRPARRELGSFCILARPGKPRSTGVNTRQSCGEVPRTRAICSRHRSLVAKEPAPVSRVARLATPRRAPSTNPPSVRDTSATRARSPVGWCEGPRKCVKTICIRRDWHKSHCAIVSRIAHGHHGAEKWCPRASWLARNCSCPPAIAGED